MANDSDEKIIDAVLLEMHQSWGRLSVTTPDDHLRIDGLKLSKLNRLLDLELNCTDFAPLFVPHHSRSAGTQEELVEKVEPDGKLMFWIPLYFSDSKALVIARPSKPGVGNVETALLLRCHERNWTVTREISLSFE